MGTKRSFGEDVFEYGNYVFMALVAFIMFYPFWHQLSLSLSSPAEATRGGLFILPREFTVAAYRLVMQNPFIWTSFFNSVYVAVVTTFLGVLITSMLAYGLSKPEVVGHRVLSFLVVFCIVFNGGLIPTYLLIFNLGLIDSMWALILPFMLTPFNTVIMRNFFRNLPAELEEAAIIDGAGPLRVFFTIVMPLSKAVLATVGLWLAVSSWNNFLAPLIYLTSRGNFTLPLFIRQVIEGQFLARETGEGAASAIESVVAATIIVSLVPILCVYPFLQKHFVKGVMIGSVKG